MTTRIINNNGASRAQRAMGARLRSWRPELPDHRDRIFKASGAVLRTSVAPLGIERKIRIHDQGQSNSCTGHAGTSALETTLSLSGDAAQLSRAFPYYLAREMIGEAHLDMGAYNRDIMKSFAKYGVCRESSWRFSTAKITTKPSATAYKRAAEMLAGPLANLSYERVTSLEMMLHAINDGFAVLFGFVVYDDIYGLTRSNDVLPMPREDGVPIGGHAVVADGYDIEKRLVNVQNSWGTAWGNKGRYRMPFDWFIDPRRLTDDLWIIRKTG